MKIRYYIEGEELLTLRKHIEVCFNQDLSPFHFDFLTDFSPEAEVFYLRRLDPLKWIVWRHKDACKNSRLRLEYTYLLFDKFIKNRIKSEIRK